MDTIFGIKKERTNRPLMYQGVSDRCYGATDDIPLPSEGDDIDFEGEFGVITDRVPMGITVEATLGHIRLLVQINDWSLRRIAPIEMKTGFGWVQAKPPCSMSSVAVTPDEASAQWPDARVAPPAFPIAPIYGLGDRLHRSAHQRRLLLRRAATHLELADLE
jgi:fumarylacetoacetate (FAA) hydrolase